MERVRTRLNGELAHGVGEEDVVLSTISCRAWRRALPLVVVLLVVMVGLLGSPMAAYAQDPAPGYTEGIWTDHEPSNTQSFTGEGTSRIYWGDPVSGDGKSGYEFVGATLPNPMPLDGTFELGTFTHYNFPITVDHWRSALESH